MTTPILTAARLSGKRLVATLVVAVDAAIATGVISAQALQTWRLTGRQIRARLADRKPWLTASRRRSGRLWKGSLTAKEHGEKNEPKPAAAASPAAPRPTRRAGQSAGTARSSRSPASAISPNVS